MDFQFGKLLSACVDFQFSKTYLFGREGRQRRKGWGKGEKEHKGSIIIL